ncbi:hypothetical protein [Streptomyces sp. M54]|uniref:hypothetical protein n=1 Tax=Streptomyces sp. M54 TaxID=2759525 RepID=UPI001A8D879C|nr:hypothetical protein [Streptomyces sp. M54]QSS94137.1 hypothetical protein H3V39_29715 [Streptomyces sp. M54]
MTPHPGAPRANTSRLRCLLAALLLTVLTLAGGTAAADAAVPALANAASTQAAGSTPSAGSGPATGPAATTGTGSEARHAVGSDRHVEDRRWPDRRAHDRQGPEHAHSTAAGPGAGAVARAEHEHPRAAADPAQTPRAGSGRAYLLVHAPPPPHDVLAPAAPGPAVPRGGVRLSAADSFDVPGSRSGALPDVRGPPSRTTGPTTGHAFRTAADPASRPH